MEEGEICDDGANISGLLYDPSLEWPGDENSDKLGGSSTAPYSLHDERALSSSTLSEKQASSNPLTSPGTSLRLIVNQSSVLPKVQTLVLLDGYSELQIGRDAPSSGGSIPRLRLKEMEVSKLHATIYWDQDRQGWAVVDMGSKHGTFHQSVRVPSIMAAVPPLISVPDNPGPSNWRNDRRGMRLSPPRVASIPYNLAHSDTLSIGSTTLAVHIHPSGTPCADCSPSSGDEVPLFEHPNKKRKRAGSEAVSTPGQAPEIGRDPKKAMAILKRSLLSRHESAAPSASDSKATSASYVDRSARRRALHSDSPDPTVHQRTSTPTSSAPSRAPTPPSSAPAAPLSNNNIGHRLLLKQGWQPGTGLGVSGSDPGADTDSVALTQPLEIAGNVSRAGLGMTTPSTVGEGNDSVDWKEVAKLRRWASLKATEPEKT